MTQQYILVATDTGQLPVIPQTQSGHWTTFPEVFFGGASLVLSLAVLCVRQSLKEREALICHLRKQNEILLEEITENDS